MRSDFGQIKKGIDSVRLSQALQVKTRVFEKPSLRNWVKLSLIGFFAVGLVRAFNMVY